MQEDAQSPYASPTAEVGGAAGDADDLYSAFLGPKNAGYYQAAFEKIRAGGGSMGWHWPACLITWFWLAYRKMWGWFFMYWLLYPFAIMLVAALAGMAHESLVFVVYFVGYFIIPPMYANALYYRHATNKIARAQYAGTDPQAQALEAARLGGTSNVVIIIIPAFVILIGILAAISIPAYQDYTIRAQVAEGLSLSGGVKAAVSEFYYDNGSAPNDNAEAGLADAMSISGKYTQSVAVDGGEIVITYGNQANQLINGEVLLLTPSDDDGTVVWTCGSPSIAPKHLPAACRR